MSAPNTVFIIEPTERSCEQDKKERRIHSSFDDRHGVLHPELIGNPHKSLQKTSLKRGRGSSVEPHACFKPDRPPNPPHHHPNMNQAANLAWCCAKTGFSDEQFLAAISGRAAAIVAEFVSLGPGFFRFSRYLLETSPLVRLFSDMR